MLSTKKYLFFVILLSCTISAFGFKPAIPGDITIHIAARPSYDFNVDYWFDIYKTKESLKIVYSHEHYFRREGIKIFKDSIIVRDKVFLAYDTLLNDIGNSSIKDLENAEANKNRFVLDGVHFNFTIVSAVGIKEVHANTPNSTSNKLLSQLLTQTFAIYSSNHVDEPTDFNDINFHLSVFRLNSSDGQHLMMDIFKTTIGIKIIYTWRDNDVNSLVSDSLFIDKKKNPSYDDLLNRVVIASSLANQPAEKWTNPYGTVNVIVDVVFKSDFREFSLRAPDATKNPLAYELIVQTLAQYRGGKDYIFLNKQKTFGY